MNKRMSVYQFFVIMILFQYGSVVLYFLSSDARQDIWISYLVYSLVGILIQIMYIALYEKYPNDTLITYLPKIYGKFIGNVLGLIYICYFIYVASIIFREFIDLASVTALRYTPKIIYASLAAFIIIYATRCGIETIVSMAQMYIIILIVIKVVSFLLILLTPNAFDLSNLEPILDNGIIKTLKSSWLIIMAPYGETIVFTMLYPLVVESKKIKKFAIIAIILEGVILAFNNILFICTLGVNFAINSNFPLLETYRIIDLGDFLTRLDIIFVLSFIVDGFFKISIFMYVAVFGTFQLFKLKTTDIVSVVLGIIMLAVSFLVSNNIPQQLSIGRNFIMKYIHFPIQIIIPVITLIFCYTRKTYIKEKIKK
ncbi:GerAB/ArcD/ProY family transporter [Clostridium tyrobutyricum]|uniref:GerAB/ArcD/ProY family transporter n=1 Tax=Clostridium tyrobutyricum TaxID=1519 RepID=UPI00189E12D1|nr:endospore germination permease [Clostridium tyrobutyricum]MBV4440851.1 spore germination protein [Clostridium tyrobutyricum]